jgi:hypothetical protein
MLIFKNPMFVLIVIKHVCFITNGQIDVFRIKLKMLKMTNYFLLFDNFKKGERQSSVDPVTKKVNE